MSKKHKILSFISVFGLIFIIFQSTASQETKKREFDPEKTYSVQQLNQDFAIFQNALEDGHAGLYRYTPKQELNKQFDDISKKLNQPLTEVEFYRLILPLIAYINDGHTRVTLPSSSTKYAETLPVMFPFNLRIVDKKPHLFRNYSDNKDLVMGSELLTLNGHPAFEIIEKMLPYIPSDAHIQTSKYRRLESTTYFGALYNLVFGQTEDYTLTYREYETAKTKTLEVKGISPKEVNRIFEERYLEETKPDLPIALEHKNYVTILTINTFGSGGYQKAKIDYPLFLKKTFKSLDEKGVKHLIIDLRNNGGGDDLFGRLLVSYLMDKNYAYYKHLRMNRKEYSFLEYTNVPLEQRKLPEERYKANDEGTFDLLGHPNLGTHKPMEPTFKGKVYVLISGRSFSATGECTSIIHYHKKAVFIGAECGSGYYGNTSGFMPWLTLPNTKIQVRIPMLRYTMAVSDYPLDRGIIPDYPVSPTIEDLLEDRDAAMEFTLKLIDKNK